MFIYETKANHSGSGEAVETLNIMIDEKRQIPADGDADVMVWADNEKVYVKIGGKTIEGDRQVSN